MYKDKDVNVAHVRFFFEIFFAQILLDSACVTLDFFFAKQMKVFYTRRREILKVRLKDVEKKSKKKRK